MTLDPAVLLALALRCAPGVAPSTVLAVVRAESALNPYAIGVNRGGPLARTPQYRDEALAVAQRLQAAGANFDLGLAQINSANLARLGLSLDDAFDPCRNLAAAGQLLTEAYARAHTPAVAAQAALRTALSLYNTGDPDRGVRNGYVARVVAAAIGQGLEPRPPAPAPRAPPPAWDAFGDLGAAAFVAAPGSAAGAAP